MTGFTGVLARRGSMPVTDWKWDDVDWIWDDVGEVDVAPVSRVVSQMSAGDGGCFQTNGKC